MYGGRSCSANLSWNKVKSGQTRYDRHVTEELLVPAMTHNNKVVVHSNAWRRAYTASKQTRAETNSQSGEAIGSTLPVLRQDYCHGSILITEVLYGHADTKTRTRTTSQHLKLDSSSWTMLYYHCTVKGHNIPDCSKSDRSPHSGRARDQTCSTTS